MEVGLFIRFGKPVVGREHEAVTLLGEIQQYFSELKEKGTITWFETMLRRYGDLEHESGFTVLRGPEEELRVLRADERFVTYMIKASAVASHFEITELFVGDAVTEQIGLVSKAYSDLGI